MEERTLIKSTQINVKAICIIISVLVLALIFIQIRSIISDGIADYNAHMALEKKHFGLVDQLECYKCEHDSALGYALDNSSAILLPAFLVTCGFIVLVFLFYSCIKSELTVTNKRVYGKTTFGKRVDLPIDSVSAVAVINNHTISVSTSSGRISFRSIKNAQEIHSVLSQLLIERQDFTKATSVNRSSSASNADELKKYKELLDSGVISQEEFDAKKKQLLGL